MHHMYVDIDRHVDTQNVLYIKILEHFLVV